MVLLKSSEKQVFCIDKYKIHSIIPRMEKNTTKIKQLINLDKKIEKLPKISATEQQILDGEQRFEAVYHSNKLEGNKLSKNEARKAILSE